MVFMMIVIILHVKKTQWNGKYVAKFRFVCETSPDVKRVLVMSSQAAGSQRAAENRRPTSACSTVNSAHKFGTHSATRLGRDRNVIFANFLVHNVFFKVQVPELRIMPCHAQGLNMKLWRQSPHYFPNCFGSGEQTWYAMQCQGSCSWPRDSHRPGHCWAHRPANSGRPRGCHRSRTKLQSLVAQHQCGRVKIWFCLGYCTTHCTNKPMTKWIACAQTSKFPVSLSSL